MSLPPPPFVKIFPLTAQQYTNNIYEKDKTVKCNENSNTTENMDHGKKTKFFQKRAEITFLRFDLRWASRYKLVRIDVKVSIEA